MPYLETFELYGKAHTCDDLEDAFLLKDDLQTISDDYGDFGAFLLIFKDGHMEIVPREDLDESDVEFLLDFIQPT